METGKEYPVFSFSAKDYNVGRYLVAADNIEAAKKYVYNINHTVSPIKIDVDSGIEFKNLKYICTDCTNKCDAICIINALPYVY